MPKLIKFMTPVLVLVAGAGAIVLLNATKPEPEQNDEPPRATSLFVEPARENTVLLNVSTQGEVRARREIDLVAQVSGRVVEVAPGFADGGSFGANEVILQIEDTDYRVAVTNAEAEVARWQTILLQAEADAEVARQQLAGRSNNPLGLKEPQIAEARAGLLAAKANLQQAEANLQRTSVTLPYEGRLREKYVDLGQFVTAGTPLARVFSTDTAEVRLPLTDTQLFTLGLPVGYQAADPASAPEVVLSARLANRDLSWTGQLVRIESAFDSSTRLVYGVVEVEDPYNPTEPQSAGMPLAVGLFVTAELPGREISDATVIPREALRAGNRVYVVADGLLQIRDVEVEHTDDSRAVVRGGLNPGEQVVVSPVRDPVTGMRVEPIQRSAVAAEPGAAVRQGDAS